MTWISYRLTGIAMLLILFAGTLESWSADKEKPFFTKHFQNTLFDITENAAYSIEILLDDKEYKIGKDVIGIVVHDAHDEDVKGAEISFDLTDLAVGKKIAVTPAVTDKGNGLYIVSGLDLQRQGKWELVVTVKKNLSDGRVKFLFPDARKTSLSKGRYSP